MPELDRIVTYVRTEQQQVRPQYQVFNRPYHYSDNPNPQGGLRSGRIVIANQGVGTGNYNEIGSLSQAATANALVLSTIDSNGRELHDSFPPPYIAVVTSFGHGYFYRVESADHTGRNRRNSIEQIEDTWFVKLNAAATQLFGNGLASIADNTPMDAIGYHDPNNLPIIDVDVTHQLWASRRDPGPSDQIENLFRTRPTDAVTRADIIAVWRFRNHAGAVVPQHLDSFTDGDGVSWTVLGVSEAGRDRFVDLYAGYSTVP